MNKKILDESSFYPEQQQIMLDQSNYHYLVFSCIIIYSPEHVLQGENLAWIDKDNRRFATVSFQV